jgi:hypothetical protein
MTLMGPASLSTTLLVVKGAASPSRATTLRQRRIHDHSTDGIRVALRVDEARHRRLRLASAHFRKSAQSVLLAALDHYLDSIVPSMLDERCPCIARNDANSAVVTPLPTRTS